MHSLELWVVVVCFYQCVFANIPLFSSGIPETVPCSSVNRQCSSGLQAIINIAGRCCGHWHQTQSTQSLSHPEGSFLLSSSVSEQ